MLTELSVQHLALVEKTTIPFAPGLNVITGETGAGKSVLMGALNLILGARADKKVLRTGAGQGAVRGVFSLAEPAAVDALLKEAGLEPCGDGLLILRREIRAEGPGRQFVNDQTVTLALLKRIGDLLVDMHGPYDHQSLLNPDTQRAIVDAAGVPEKAKTDYAAVWRGLREARRRREDLEGDEGRLEEQMDLLRYRVTELEDAALEPDEEEALREEHTLAGNSQNILEGVNGALQALEESEGNASDPLAAARRVLGSIRDLHPDAETWLEELERAQRQVRELAVSLRLAGESMEVDPARLDWLDQRLGLYSRMRKKYGPTVEDALETLSESKARLEEMENREQILADLDEHLAALTLRVDQAGTSLREARKKSGETLGKRILEQLVDLGFPHARFKIAVETAEPDGHGADDIDFRFAPNPGESMRSLGDIASSGEISRVMLAIKTLLADQDRIPVMVFDEIDANVGGEMGHAIGRKMAQAGRTRQVISITHLPQVAVHGDHHLAVAKEVLDGRTFTRVHPLGGQDRVDEISRMLGGARRAGLSLDHARELLENAK